MYSLKELQSIVQKELENQNFDIAPRELYEPIEYVLSIGGKRLRPVLMLMACDLFSCKIEKAIRPAIGIEVFHNFTLLHDDIMDHADLRRNVPTVHKKWDENVAILSGDAMMIKAYEYFYDCDSEILKNVLKTFNQTALEVCEGQQYDMNFETRDDVKVEEYLEMIRLKTSVLLAASLKIGALIGGALKDDAENLYDFGKYIGLAFQLQDDFLDVYGDVAVFGKKIGGDILCNKKTFLLINALELAEGELEERLVAQLTKTDFVPEEKIKEVTAIYDALKVKELSKQKMDDYYLLAIEALDKVSVDKSKKEELVKFADKLQNRVN